MISLKYWNAESNKREEQLRVEVQVQRIFTLEDRVIFDVEILGGDYYSIGDVFETDDQKLRFKLLGIGMDNQTESKNKSFLVEPLQKTSGLNAYLEKIFIKKIE